MSDPGLSVWLMTGELRARGRCDNLLRLSRHLPEVGMKVRLFCIDAKRLSDELKDQLNVSEVPFLTGPLWRLLAAPALRKLSPSSRPDIIHAATIDVLPIAQWLAAQFKIPCVLTLVDHPGQQRLWPYRVHDCDAVITLSDGIRDEVIAAGICPADRIVVVPPGVEASPHENSQQILANEHAPVIGTAGPLEPVKGLPYFLRAARQVLDHHPTAEFVVAGDGGEEAGLRRLSRELKIDRQVTFVPPLSDFRDVLSAFDVFCQPSLQQGFGTVMLQAMSLGRPVIATDVGAAHLLINHDHTGLLVPPGDAEAIATAIQRLLAHPETARRIGASARLLATRKYPISTMVQRTVNVYQRVLNERGNRSRPVAETARLR